MALVANGRILCCTVLLYRELVRDAGFKARAPRDRGSRVNMGNKQEPAVNVLCAGCAGAGDGDTQAGPGGGEEKEGGSGEAPAGGDESQAEVGGAGGEAQGEAEITGVVMVSLRSPPQS